MFTNLKYFASPDIILYVCTMFSKEHPRMCYVRMYYLDIDADSLWSYIFHWPLCSWLSHYATIRKITGLSPDEVDFFFSLPNPSSCSMALELSQPLTEMSTRNLARGKGQLASKAGNLTATCELNA
jgi:hypothetical protein